MAFFFFFTINARTISCSVLITGAFPLMVWIFMNFEIIENWVFIIEIKRPVRHFTISDFFFNSEQKRAYNCKMKKNIVVFVNSDMRRILNIIGFDFFFFLNWIKSKNTVFHLGFFVVGKITVIYFDKAVVMCFNDFQIS